MTATSRRTILSAAGAAPFAGGLLAARPARAQGAPMKIGLLSDMSGPYRDLNGPNSIAATRHRAPPVARWFFIVPPFQGTGVCLLRSARGRRPDWAPFSARSQYSFTTE